MEIRRILNMDCTKCAVQLTSKKRTLEYIAKVAVDALPALRLDDVICSLVAREKMGSTGIGNGIAIPHGRIYGIEQPLAVVVTSSSGIEFDAIDNQLVDIFFAILVPVDEAEGHLKTLSAIAEKLSNKEIVRQIRKANSDKLLYELLV